MKSNLTASDRDCLREKMKRFFLFGITILAFGIADLKSEVKVIDLNTTAPDQGSQDQAVKSNKIQVVNGTEKGGEFEQIKKDTGFTVNESYFSDKSSITFTAVQVGSDGFFYQPNADKQFLNGLVHIKEPKGKYDDYEIYYSRGKLVDGKKHGLWMGFYEGLSEGSSYVEVVNYDMGVKHGEYRKWDAQKIRMSAFTGKDFDYTMGLPPHILCNYKNGKLDGKYLARPAWNGLLGREEGDYIKGEPDGEYSQWYDGSERIYSTKIYNQGKLLEENKWAPNGDLVKSTQLDSELSSLMKNLEPIEKTLTNTSGSKGNKASEVDPIILSERGDELLESVKRIDKRIAKFSNDISGPYLEDNTNYTGEVLREGVMHGKFDDLSNDAKRSIKEIRYQFKNNKVKLEISYTHKFGILQNSKQEKFVTETILLVDGSFVYALVHAMDGPLRVSFDPHNLISIEAQITSERLSQPIPVKEVAFMDDPRIIIIPLYSSPNELREAGLQLFEAPQNPFLFGDVVVVDIGGGIFGTTKFRRDSKDGNYIKMDYYNLAFPGSSFNPGTGDLIFSQKAELMGIMINGSYAFHVKNLGSRILSGSRTLLGSSFDSEKSNSLLRDLSKQISGIPERFRY